MDKQKAQALAEKYNMEFLKANVITQQNIGVYCLSADLIPELDDLVEQDILPCCATRLNCGVYYYYRIYCPASWLDLWGWC